MRGAEPCSPTAKPPFVLLCPGCWVFTDPIATFGDHAHTRLGSFGLLVEDLIPEEGDEDRRLVLTAAHLFRDIKDGATIAGYPGGGPEPANTDGECFGLLRRRVPLYFLPSIAVDAAVIKPFPDTECSNDMGTRTPCGIRDLLLKSEQDTAIAVRKHGASTGETIGELLSIQSDHYMEDVEARYSTGWWAYGSAGAPFAARGDSGSVVLDDQSHVVGMLVAVNRQDGEDGGDGFVHAIKPIFSALKVRLPKDD